MAKSRKNMQEKSERRSEKLLWPKTYQAQRPWQVKFPQGMFERTTVEHGKQGMTQSIFYKENFGLCGKWIIGEMRVETGRPVGSDCDCLSER